MKPADTKRIYKLACKLKHAEEDRDVFENWHAILRHLEARDVEAALRKHCADTTPTLAGRVKGAFMPDAAELLAIAEEIVYQRSDGARAERARERRRAEIEEFWKWAAEWMEDTGNGEEELLNRFPKFRGTRPQRSAA
jgi:hypothetical protein